MPKYKLSYFNGKARAESTRYLFKLAGVEFEDFRFEMEDWAALRPTYLTFQVPVLEIDGKQYAQSKAILTYLAKIHGLHGKTDLDGLRVDEVIHTADDVIPPSDLIFFAANEQDKEKYTKQFCEVDVPVIYQRLTRILEQPSGGGGDFFVGNSITAADLHFVSMVETADVYFPDSLKSFPKLQAVFDRVVSNPTIAEYIKERPVTAW